LHRHSEANQLSNLISLCQSCHMKVERGSIHILTPIWTSYLVSL
jgi:hypothetical protein